MYRLPMPDAERLRCAVACQRRSIERGECPAEREPLRQAQIMEARWLLAVKLRAAYLHPSPTRAA
jgi:hypothetical protein